MSGSAGAGASNAAARGGPGRVLGAVVHYGLGAYVPQLVNFFLVPVYTRYLAPTEMGALEIILSTQLLLVLVMRMGLSGAMQRLHFDEGEGGQRDLMTTTHHAMMVSALTVGALWLWLGPRVMSGLGFGDVPFWPHMLIAVGGAVLQVAPEVQRRILQAREESALSAKLSAAQGVLTTALNLLCVVGLSLGALGVLVATTLSTAVFWLVAVVRQRRDLTGTFRPHLLRQGLAYGLPLVPHSVAAWGQQHVGRYVLGSVATMDVLGQLALAGRVAAPLNVLIGAFSSAYPPVYYSWRTNLDAAGALSEARRVAHAVTAVGGLAVIGAATVGAWFTRHAMADSYGGAAALVGVVAGALYLHLLYMVVSVEIFYAKRTRWISWIFILSAALTIALSWWWSAAYGALGAALAQVVGGAMSLASTALYARMTFPLSLEPRPLVAFCALAAIACALAAFAPVPTGAAWDGAATLLAWLALSAVAVVAAGSQGAMRQAVGLLARRLGRRTAG